VKKDKAKRHQQQKQKKTLKKIRRAQAMKKAPPKTSKITEAVFSNERMAFWAAHGINCILSDYSKGTWTPLFEAIYESGPVTLTPEEVSGTLMGRFGPQGIGWPLEAKAAFSWMIQKREVMYAYYRTATRLLKDNDFSCDAEELAVQPHNSIVWGLFDELKQKIAEDDGVLKAEAEEAATDSPPSDQPSEAPPEVGSIGDKTPAP